MEAVDEVRGPRRGLSAALTIGMLLMVPACGQAEDDAPPPASSTPGQFGDAADGIASLRTSMKAVETAMTDAASGLRTAAESPQDGVLEVRTCGSAPTAAAEVYAYGRLVGGEGPLVDRLKAASDRLQKAGWTKAGSNLSASSPGIGLTKGPAQLLLAGDVRRDGEALSFSVQGPCYNVESKELGQIGPSRSLDFGR